MGARAPATWGLCAACLAVWLAQTLAAGVGDLPGLNGVGADRALGALFGLRAEAVRAGALWQPFSYAFLHGGWAHLAANLFGLWVTGSALEAVLGARRMVGLFALGAAAGACGFLGSLALDPRLSGGLACVGASAMVAACFGAATALAPRERVVLWVAVLPIPLRAFWLAPVFLLFTVCEAWWWPQVTAYGAHLGGWLAGLAFGRAAAAR